MLQEGDKVPSFKAMDQDGNLFSFSNRYPGRVIIFFYPASGTPTCTDEACNLRDNHSLLKEHGFEVIGISPDMPAAQEKFIQKHNLPFTLLSDPQHKVMDKFDVWGEKVLYGRRYMGVKRTTFVIEKGIIIKVFRRPRAKRHAEEILKSLGYSVE